MKTNNKKILVFLLAGTMLSGALPFAQIGLANPMLISASAAVAKTQIIDQYSGNACNLYWELDDEGTLTISGSGDMPSFYNKVEPWSAYKNNIKTIVLEEEVTALGVSVFRYYQNLETIYLYSHTAVIRHNFALEGSNNIQKIYIPYDALDGYKQKPGWNNLIDKFETLPSFVNKVTLKKEYNVAENFENAGTKIDDVTGKFAEDVTLTFTAKSSFDRETGKTGMPTIASATISSSIGSADVTIPDFADYGTGDYWYEVAETTGNTAGVGYNSNNYYMHITVGKDGDSIGAITVTLHKTAPNDDGTYTNNADDKTDTIVNTYGAGSLKVTKAYEGTMSNDTDYFEMTVTFTAGKTVTGDITYTGGFDSDKNALTNQTITGNWTGSKEVSFLLKKGDEITFTNIPSGVTYKVVEKDYSTDGFDTPVYAFDNTSETGDTVTTNVAWSENFAQGTISDSADVLTITNTKNKPIDVGVVVESAPYIMLFLTSVLAGSTYILIKRRKRDIEE